MNEHVYNFNVHFFFFFLFSKTKSLRLGEMNCRLSSSDPAVKRSMHTTESRSKTTRRPDSEMDSGSNFSNLYYYVYLGLSSIASPTGISLSNSITARTTPHFCLNFVREVIFEACPLCSNWIYNDSLVVPRRLAYCTSLLHVFVLRHLTRA